MIIMNNYDNNEYDDGSMVTWFKRIIKVLHANLYSSMLRNLPHNLVFASKPPAVHFATHANKFYKAY